MEFGKSKRKIVVATSVLLVVMLAFTLISKSIYGYQLPQITVTAARKASVGRVLKLPGAVSQSREYAATVLPYIQVDTVEVVRGDEVSEGDLLFALNMEDLKEQIAEKEVAIQKLQVQISTLQHNQGLADRKKELDTNRALEDYLDSAADSNTRIDRALAKEEYAQQDLEKHLEDAPQITNDTDRAAAQESYDAWIMRGKSLQKDVDEWTKRLAAAQKRVDELQAEYDAALQEARPDGTYFSMETLMAGEMEEEEAFAEPAPEFEPEPEYEPEPEPEPEYELESEPEYELESEPESGSEEPTNTSPTTEISTESAQEISADSEPEEIPIAEESFTAEESSAAEECITAEESTATEEALKPEESDEADADAIDTDEADADATGTDVTGTDEVGADTTEAGSVPEEESEDGNQTPDVDLTELEKCLQEAIAARDACQAELDRVTAKWQEYQSESRSRPDFSGEDLEKKSWESQRTVLERNVESAQWDYEDSLHRKQEELQDAQRRVDDAAAPENIQDTLTLYQLELSYEKEVLSRYRKLLENGGQILAEKSGVVTGVNVSAGNNTPDGAAVVYAAKDSDLKFQTTLSKEEKRYVNQGTEGKMEFGMQQELLSVDYLELLSDGSYAVDIFLPEGVGKMGESGTFVITYQSAPYQQCIPIQALHRDENQRDFIYVVRRQQGILGEELAAEKRFVTVEEQGDSYAALADGTLADGEEVISSATKELTDGAVVRYRLE